MNELKEDRFLKSRICPICNKSFIPAPYHVYRDKFTTRRMVCSWACVCESERLKAIFKNKKKMNKGDDA